MNSQSKKSRSCLPLLASVVAWGLTSLVPVGHASEMGALTWESVQSLVRRCAVQPFRIDANGRKLFEMLESTCPELRKLDATTVEFDREGHSYRATITESALSDGGDLQDIVVVSLDPAQSGAVVLSAETLLAFSDPILALALGDATGLTEKQLLDDEQAE